MATPVKPGGRRDREHVALARAHNRQLAELLQRLLETENTNDKLRYYLMATMATVITRQGWHLEQLAAIRRKEVTDDA